MPQRFFNSVVFKHKGENMVNNCLCSRYHRTVVESINERLLEIPYKQLSDSQKDKITKNVIEAKKRIFNEVLKDFKNYDAVKCSDSEVFKQKFSHFKKFHKCLENREKAEMIFEKCIIDRDVEVIFPAKREQEFIIEDLSESDCAEHFVKYRFDGRHDMPIYYRIHEFNIVTGRVVTEGFQYKHQIEGTHDYKKAIRRELNQIMSNDNEYNKDTSCSIV